MSSARRGRDRPDGFAPDTDAVFGAIVDRIRALTLERNFVPPVSDDTDAWMEGSYGYSPNNVHNVEAAAGVREADRLVRQLIRGGAAASPAVANGLRMQGRWRLHLFPFVEAFRGHREIVAALERVVARSNDSCRRKAWVLLSTV